MKRYLIELCRTDGTTPLGQCPMYDVEGVDVHDAINKLLRLIPGTEVVSVGLKSEIEDMWKRHHQPPKSYTVVETLKSGALF